MSEMNSREASVRLKVYQSYLYQLLLLGKIKGRQDENGQWFVDRESVEEYDAKRKRKPREVEV